MNINTTARDYAAEWVELIARAPRYVHDSWIAACEAAGVYSRKPPLYRYRERPTAEIRLTRAEIWILAQRHLNSVFVHNEFEAWNGESICDAFEKSQHHEARFRELYELLPVEDQQRFDRQIEIRKRYVHSIQGEVHRCGRLEEAFWARVEAGLVSDKEIKNHRTPGFLMGSLSMPRPADGGPEPEQWDLFQRDDGDEAGHDAGQETPPSP